MADVEKVLLEQVRSWLVDEKVGLISNADVVVRADEAIEKLDEVPDYLIALSLGETVRDVDRLDLLRGPLDRQDLAGLAGRLLAGLNGGSLSLDDVASVAFQFSFPEKQDLIEVWADFFWISDQAHLAEIGAVDGSNLRQEVEEVLRKISDQTDSN